MNIEELASKFASRYTHRSAPLESVWTFTNRTLEDFEKAIRAEVLEQAAQRCDSRYMGDQNREDMEAKRCAQAIRAMKPNR